MAEGAGFDDAQRIVWLEAGLDPVTRAFGTIEAHFDLRASAGRDPFQQQWQLRQLTRTDHQVHVRRPLEDLLPILLSHAAEHADDPLRVAVFDVLQPAQGV